MELIENRTFDEMKVGDRASVTRKLAKEDILLFAALSGDVNPAHVDEEFARTDMFHKVIAHGMWGAALISTVLGTELPGPGTIYLGQTLSFRRPVGIGDVITVTVTVKERVAESRRVVFDCQCVNQSGDVVINGTAEVLAPREKVSRPKMALPEVRVFDRYARYRDLMRRTEGMPAIRFAVVHPVDPQTLAAVEEAFKRDLIVPVLVGPEAKIVAAAKAQGFDLHGYEIVSTPHSRAAAERAVQLALVGNVQALMKGSLSTDELMDAVRAPETGLATARHMSHVYILDVPTYPRPLCLTDAFLSVHPHLDEKRDVIQNAVDLLHALGFENPKVAILAATDRIDPRLPSTLDAAALCKMAERGQITGATLDGPVPFDAAVSSLAASSRGVTSSVAGQADVLVVPDLESGQMLVKTLQYLADAHAAGLVLGAKVSIALTGPDDTLRTRVAACALAALLAHARKQLTAEPAPLRTLPLT